MFNAFVVRQTDDKKTIHLIEKLNDEDLSNDGDIFIEVEYSNINYKDAAAVLGKLPIIRKFPMIPGIDLAGTVIKSKSTSFPPGTKIIATGQSIGETLQGGFSERALLSEKNLIRLPDTLTTKKSMQIGTAGFTAMLSIMALEKSGVTPDKKSILVTGASGGVGSIACALLNKLGFTVTASTTQASHDFLKKIGVNNFVERSEMAIQPRLLENIKWGGAIDTVGGTTLAKVLAETEAHSSVAACGLVGGSELATNVMPFIIRGINLLGIDSVWATAQQRAEAWERLGMLLDDQIYEDITTPISLSEIPEYSTKIINGETKGRILLKH